VEKKLYRVRVVLFVMAEDEADASMAATRARFDIFECAARKAENITPEWNDAIPYNADDDRTCAEIMAEERPAMRPRVRPVRQPLYFEAALRTFNFENQPVRPGH
jgi:hypothetical protein